MRKLTEAHTSVLHTESITDQYSKLAENYLSGKELQKELSHYEQKGDSILVDASIEGFDDGLFDKLTVVKGSLEPLFDPDSHAIAVAVSTDDYGNIVNLDSYPELGDTYTVNYQIGYDIDSRTGERADQQTTPEEYLEYHEEEAKEVEYSVCALVTVPYSIMEEHLRFAACYWHTFCWNGADMFGVGAFNRPWQQPGEALALAKRKADVAFEFFHKLHVPFYCFHDVDVSPEGASLKEYINNFAQMVALGHLWRRFHRK